jgi:hypothetical protein
MSKCVQLTDSLIDYLEAINNVLADFGTIPAGIFPPAGPLTIPLATSKTTRSLARKVGITVVGKHVLFVINSEQDLPRVFAEVRRLAHELNSIENKLSSTLLEALGSWSVSESQALTQSHVQPSIDLTPPDIDIGVFSRHINLTPTLLEQLHLLNAALNEWSPARSGIFAPAGPLTVVIHGSSVLRSLARPLGFLTNNECVVLFIGNEADAAQALQKLQQLAAQVGEVLDAIPPVMLEKEKNAKKG